MSFQAFFAEGVKAGKRLGVGEWFVTNFARQKFFFDFALQFRVLFGAFPRTRHDYIYISRRERDGERKVRKETDGRVARARQRENMADGRKKKYA